MARAGAGEAREDSFTHERPAVVRRRRFTAEYKLRILREAEGCREPGEIGALLRREGIYSSHLALWRRQREEAAQTELDARKRGPRPRASDTRVQELERENARLQRRLKRLEQLRRKAAAILGRPLPKVEPDDGD